MRAPCLWIAVILLSASLVTSSENSVQVVSNDADEASVSVDESNSSTFDTSNVFVPSQDWQPVLPGQVVPAGLHVRINLQTGVKEAKLLSKDEAKASDPKPFDDSISQINDGPKDGTPSQSGLRSFQELQDVLAKQKMKLNSEFEQIEYLVSHYANSTTDQKLVILEDLDYLLHQYDNARDFATLGGLESIVGAALNASDSALRAKAAILFGAMVQSHPDVQERALSAGWMARLLSHMTRAGENEQVRIRLVHAISSFVRGHSRSRAELEKLDGLAVLAKLADESDEPRMKLKVLTLFQDLEVDQSTLSRSKDTLCATVSSLWHKSRPTDVYEVERFVDILHFFLSTCDLPRNEMLEWLTQVKSELRAKLSEEDEGEISAVLERVQLFVAALSGKTEL